EAHPVERPGDLASLDPPAIVAGRQAGRCAVESRMPSPCACVGDRSRTHVAAGAPSRRVVGGYVALATGAMAFTPEPGGWISGWIGVSFLARLRQCRPDCRRLLFGQRAVRHACAEGSAAVRRPRAGPWSRTWSSPEPRGLFPRLAPRARHTRPASAAR